MACPWGFVLTMVYSTSVDNLLIKWWTFIVRNQCHNSVNKIKTCMDSNNYKDLITSRHDATWQKFEVFNTYRQKSKVVSEVNNKE